MTILSNGVNSHSLPKWESIAAQKRIEAFNKIPPKWRLPSSYTDRVNERSAWNVLNVPRECGLLSDTEIEITESYDAASLVGAIAAAKLTAEEVTVAFSKRAAIAQQLTRCLTETFFDEAIARAKDLDQYLRTHGKAKGPLHGLPISLKDSFNIKGMESTIGFVSFIGKSTASTNSPLVDILLELGAVLYVKTNIPQTMMSAESENNVFGRVLNPHNLSWGAGGSSGGEGALVAMRGSILGVGTDVAGSIRIPSLCCGTFGFRPTASRIPYGGQASGSRRGNPGIQACAGPLTTSFRDLKFFMEVVLEAQPWNYDPTALAVRWQPSPKRGPIIIGYVGEDKAYPLHPPVKRVLSSAAEKLKLSGHMVKVLKAFPPISEAAYLAFKYFELDNTKTPTRHIEASGEPQIPSLKTSNIPFDDHHFTLEELFDMNAERQKIIKDWQNIWLENKLDAILMPGHRKTAGPHETYGHPPYTLVWNLVDCPSCIIPYGKVDASVDARDSEATDYEPSIVDGAPCAIQVVGRRFQDEKLLSVAEIVSSVLAG